MRWRSLEAWGSAMPHTSTEKGVKALPYDSQSAVYLSHLLEAACIARHPGTLPAGMSSLAWERGEVIVTSTHSWPCFPDSRRSAGLNWVIPLVDGPRHETFAFIWDPMLAQCAREWRAYKTTPWRCRRRLPLPRQDRG